MTPHGRSRHHGIGICRVCGVAVYLMASGRIQKHHSEVQQGRCRGSAYAPAGVALGAA